MKKHYWLYVLRLQQDKYYIGITSRKDPSSRVREHMNGFYSAQWTKKYKPTECSEKIELGTLTEDQAFNLENKRTLQYMKKYGINNVRGGKFNYSGKYVHIKLLDLFFREEDFKQFLGISFMTLVILYLGITTLRLTR